jgi:uracil-DNA glycosylase
MESRRRVLSEYNRNIYSNVLFVADAPRPFGADRTAIPLFGDQIGNNFPYLIDTIEWSRGIYLLPMLFYVILGMKEEITENLAKDALRIACYLNTLIKIMEPEYVIILGRTSLRAVQIIEPRGIRLKVYVRQIINLNERFLTPLYYTGPRGLMHRSLNN